MNIKFLVHTIAIASSLFLYACPKKGAETVTSRIDESNPTKKPRSKIKITTQATSGEVPIDATSAKTILPQVIEGTVSSTKIEIENIKVTNADTLSADNIVVAWQEGANLAANCQVSADYITMAGTDFNQLEFQPNTEYALTVCEETVAPSSGTNTSAPIASQVVVTLANVPTLEVADVDTEGNEDVDDVNLVVSPENNSPDTDYAIWVEGENQSGWLDLGLGKILAETDKFWFKATNNNKFILRGDSEELSFKVIIKFLDASINYKFQIKARNKAGVETMLSNVVELTAPEVKAEMEKLLAQEAATKEYENYVRSLDTDPDLTFKEFTLGNKLKKAKTDLEKLTQQRTDERLEFKKLKKKIYTVQIERSEKKKAKSKNEIASLENALAEYKTQYNLKGLSIKDLNQEIKNKKLEIREIGKLVRTEKKLAAKALKDPTSEKEKENSKDKK